MDTRTRGASAPLALGLCLAFAACAGPGEQPIAAEKGAGAKIERIEAAPVDAPPPGRVAVPLPVDGASVVLSSLHGAIAVGSAGKLYTGSLSGGPLEAMPLIADEGGRTSTGEIHSLVRRSGGGVLVAGEGGLFHDDDGVLLVSPLGGAPELRGEALVAVDALGSDGGEELWILTTGGAFHVAGGQIQAFSVTDAEGEREGAEAIIGIAPGKAILIDGDRAFAVDLASHTASLLVTGLGKVNGYDRSEDGTVTLATDTGLWARARASGDFTVRTFAPKGAAPEPVLAVAASYGMVVAATASSLVTIEGGEAKRRASLAPAAHGLSVDGNGDVWAMDEGALFRFATGAPVSFERDVKPFFAAHCVACHGTGKNHAPPVDFLAYDVAKERASVIQRRLSGEVSVMPPVTSEVLTAADYAVVTRWVGGGLLP